MTIKEFSGAPERTTVVHIGAPASGATVEVFAQYGYKLESRLDLDLTDAELAGASAIIISQSTAKPSNVLDELSKCAAFLNWDCQIFVQVSKDERLQAKTFEIVVNAVQTLGLPAAQRENQIGYSPFVWICDSAVKLEHIAVLIARVGSGKAPNLSLRVSAIDAEHRSMELALEDRLLLQRAFWDCSEVQLRGMEKGLSGASIYRAHASLLGGVPGPWPHPFFVKFGSRDQIEAEFRGYGENAKMYIPFHLGPRLDVDRCGLGSTRGVLVGDLVEEGQLLKHCARHGRAVPAIANLFNKTLRAWYLTSRPEPDQSVSSALRHMFRDSIPSERFKLIKKLGATLEVAEMRRLFSTCDSSPVRIGHVHGDLHAGNILVRASDAVVIDFEKRSERLPILYDAASVEAGLLVDGFERDKRDAVDLLRSLEPLYANVGNLRWMEPCHPGDPSSWFYDCVHQIRLHARQMECVEFQYAATLALVLTRKASNDQQFDVKAEERRAIAYVLAEQILLSKGK